MLSNIAIANTIIITQGKENIKIEQWKEENEIINLDLFVKSEIHFEINKDLKQIIYLYFTPAEKISSNDAKSAENFIAVLYEDYCQSYVNFTAKSLQINYSKNQRDYLIKIPQKNLRWDKNENRKFVTLVISYKIPNYIESERMGIIWKPQIDTDKTVIFSAGCQQDAGKKYCPIAENVHKTIILPQRSILRSFTESRSEFGKKNDGRFMIYWSYDPKEDNPNSYKDKFVQYSDITALKKLIWFQIIGGAIIVIPLEKFLEHIFKRFKSKNKFKNLLKLKKIPKPPANTFINNQINN